MQFVFDAESDWEFAVSLSILIVVVFVSYKLVNDEQLVYVVVKVGRWGFFIYYFGMCGRIRRRFDTALNLLRNSYALLL